MQDGFVYVAAGENGLEVVDFSNPSHPTLVVRSTPEFELPWLGLTESIEYASSGLSLRDHALLVSVEASISGQNPTIVFDISNPADPVVASVLQQDALDWAISRDFLAMALRITDAAHSDMTSMISTTRYVSGAMGAVIQNGRMKWPSKTIACTRSLVIHWTGD